MPNWLGDMVMATSFVKAVQQQFPSAEVDMIVKKGLDFLPAHFHPSGRLFIFSKNEYKGLSGAKKFGREIKRQKKYDLFLCLPDSLSSAAMAAATGAKKRIGFKKSFHSVFFTKTYRRKKNVHRVEEYIDLLGQFLQKEIPVPPVNLFSSVQERNGALVININSEASSRRLPKEKAVSIVDHLRRNIPNEIILVGSPKEKEFTGEVYSLLKNKESIKNISGQTSLPDLVNIFASAAAVLSTDSGPAHAANALHTPVVVLFGAGNEHNTAPYNKENRTIIRLGKLSCEPCTDNTCKRYGVPECLLQLDEAIITSAVQQQLSR